MYELRWMNQSDIKAAVQVHLRSFPGFFLTLMGAAFLEEFYSSVIAESTHIAFVLLHNGIITGFVVGTTQPGGFYKRLLLKFGYRFAHASIGPVLRKPITILRLLNRFLLTTGRDYALGEALLMSIAVLPENNGKGMGRMLINAFLDEAHTRQVKKIYLTTDKNDNDRVIFFYNSVGFELVHSFITPEGREMNEYLFLMS